MPATIVRLHIQPLQATSNSIQVENSDRSPTYLVPIQCKLSYGVKITAVIFPPEEEIPYNLAKDTKNNNIYESRVYGEDNELKELIAFGYLFCGVSNINELDELNTEDKGQKEVFAARYRKLLQVIVWIKKVLDIVVKLASKPNNDNELVQSNS